MDDIKPVKRKGRRPLLGVKMERRLVTLDDATMTKAKHIGAGSASAGIRKAVARYRS